MGVFEMLRWKVPAIVILLHLHLITMDGLRDDQVSCSNSFLAKVFADDSTCVDRFHAYLQAYDWVEFFSGAGKVSQSMRQVQLLEWMPS